MSVVRCENCDNDIDTDFDCEHFHDKVCYDFINCFSCEKVIDLNSDEWEDVDDEAYCILCYKKWGN